jgi:hypothetical protein
MTGAAPSFGFRSADRADARRARTGDHVAQRVRPRGLVRRAWRELVARIDIARSVNAAQILLHEARRKNHSDGPLARSCPAGVQRFSEGLRKVLQRITGDDEIGVRGIDASKLTPQDCARLTEVLSKLERLSRGAESERVENT